MPLRILDFNTLGNPESIDFQSWKDRYDTFGREVTQRIFESWRSIHVLLSNMGSLKSALGKGYYVKKYNNGFKILDSMELLYERVRIEDVRVVVIDAVNGLIEISEMRE
jgi:hypothetical protein